MKTCVWSWGSSAAFDRAGGVMLELGRNEFAGRLGWMDAADPGLGVALELSDGGGHGRAVRLPNPLVTTH